MEYATDVGFIGAAISLPLGATAGDDPHNISTKNGTELVERGDTAPVCFD